MHLSRLDRQVSSQGDLRPPMGASATNKPGGSFAFSPAPCGSPRRLRKADWTLPSFPTAPGGYDVAMVAEGIPRTYICKVARNALGGSGGDSTGSAPPVLSLMAPGGSVNPLPLGGFDTLSHQ
ncbi:hypothetical protein PCANC_07153 [Puccinia coronata f. sp. avenae]|uniref:Uncharacterized protein n=1 Tax=Puccinia coronata f. sp. avenae TaxID=200324 RepID=A0A2N5SXP3_9BASI|nr:hypothetical protein PCANC_07153 [Puccinia coronata f. sp. avenae]